MKDQAQPLGDGQYSCSATLHIKDGRAIVVLHDMFNLMPGATIPLARQECNLLIEKLEGSSVAILNGQAII
jgi:hypothetical protein